MKFINFCTRVITSCFYLLLFLIPIIFWNDTSELFEFNKMWLTFAITIIIGFAWAAKMIFQRRFLIQRSALDIPILLFLLSQILATIFSLDSYVSFWGYYSRFNGGLLSTLTYIFLFYAFISNVEKRYIIRYLHVSLLAGVFVSLWGLPAHFGYDPTCFVFRGTLDVSCWTFAFQPKVRIFSTLGQPDWLAAYLAILIPVAIGLGMRAQQAYVQFMQQNKKFSASAQIKSQKTRKFVFFAGYTLVLVALFYTDLLYTRAKSGVIGIAVPVALFFAVLLGYYLWQEFAVRKESLEKAITRLWRNNWYGLVVVILMGMITFIIGTPFSQLDRFTLAGLKNHGGPTAAKTVDTVTKLTTSIPHGDLGGTDSGKIRLLVWSGALNSWKDHILFGTGVETFAYTYYQYKPVAHNLTSEWDYLYNKAHNEYLNYLATTGAFGLITYLAMIGLFIYLSLKYVFSKSEYRNSKQIPDTNDKSSQHVRNLNFEDSKLFQTSNFDIRILALALFTSYLTILITDFFGFSVVITNLYLFLIPAFVLILGNALSSQKVFALPNNQTNTQQKEAAPWQYIGLAISSLLALYLLIMLGRYWQADRDYGLGNNYDKANYYQNGHDPLTSAVNIRPEEPIFKDELSVNDAVLATVYAQQKDTANTTKFGQEAIKLSTNVVTNHPNNVVFWKTRVRVFYALSELNPQYLSLALEAIQKAHQLAPTDAKISYNLGLLYGQTNQFDNAISTLQDTIKLKPDYRDAYYALGLMEHEAAVDTKGHVTKPDIQQKAVDTMHFILDNFGKTDKGAKDALKQWGEK